MTSFLAVVLFGSTPSLFRGCIQYSIDEQHVLLYREGNRKAKLEGWKDGGKLLSVSADFWGRGVGRTKV
jgi:hypothetical protein